MKQDDRNKAKARRNFLKLAGVAGVAGGAAMTGAAAKADGPRAEPATQCKGYRMTEHVRKSYETARF
ncbi:MAG: twin-arginine translocation signal domain-containing protein [Geminicoccaceae bacterium]|nr:twin-arginine translocation signal domain-containing protein [Geminicoccaceae bacterium]